MTILITAILAAALLCAATLAGWRWLDRRADRAEMARLRALQPPEPARFSSVMIEGLPEPARRYFRFAIDEGAPLFRVVELEMTGRFGMGTKAAPNYMAMRARQVLAAPQGFVWQMSAGRWPLGIGGSDSAFWTRFWLGGLIPVARFGGTRDHARSAFGRYVAEAVFWSPAALLPGPGITWEGAGADTARVTLRKGDLEQAVEVTVAADGCPVQVAFQRWSNAAPDGVFRMLPFGGLLGGFRRFGGFRLPTRVEAGNFFGTEEYFPFFIAEVTDVRFPGRD